MEGLEHSEVGKSLVTVHVEFASFQA
jgi:hypothetical protein